MPISIKVPNQTTTSVRINNQNQQKVRSMTPIYQSGSSRLVDLTDVSIVDQSNYSTVVFNSTTNKYEIKTLPIINGGKF